MKKYLLRFLLKDKTYLKEMLSKAEREISYLKEQISKKDDQIEFLQTLNTNQNKSVYEGQVSTPSNLSTITQSKAAQNTSKPVNVVPLTKRSEVENKTYLEKKPADVEESILEDVLDHFDPMNSAEIALLDEEIEKNRELERRKPKDS
tara:strand:+ start:1377 stop:1820 length:444 start_codon:yes stop_codon:yes gene_type:complete